MDDRAPQGWRHLAPPLYLVALVLIMIPAIDFTTNVLPFVVGDIQWRYGAIGLLASFTHTPLLGVLIASAAAVIRGDATVQRIIGIFCLTFAGFILLLTGSFALDVLQLRRDVEPAGLMMFQLGAAKAGFKHVISVAVFSWMGLALLKGVRKGKRQRSEPAAPLIRPS